MRLTSERSNSSSSLSWSSSSDFASAAAAARWLIFSHRCWAWSREERTIDWGGGDRGRRGEIQFWEEWDDEKVEMDAAAAAASDAKQLGSTDGSRWKHLTFWCETAQFKPLSVSRASKLNLFPSRLRYVLRLLEHLPTSKKSALDSRIYVLSLCPG